MCDLTLTGETILFVDIDGPLLPMKLHYHPINLPIMSNPNRKYMTGNDLFRLKKDVVFDPVMVHAINKWIEATGGKIVLSTAWAEDFTYDQMEQIFKNNGICVDCIHDQWMTPRLSTWDRGEEISHWLFNNLGKIKNYMVIDDDISVMSTPGIKKDKVLLIDLRDGLTWNQLWQGCEILGLVNYDKVLG